MKPTVLGNHFSKDWCIRKTFASRSSKNRAARNDSNELTRGGRQQSELGLSWVILSALQPRAGAIRFKCSLPTDENPNKAKRSFLDGDLKRSTMVQQERPEFGENISTRDLSPDEGKSPCPNDGVRLTVLRSVTVDCTTEKAEFVSLLFLLLVSGMTESQGFMI